jgi:hypothetical protein
MLEKEFLKWFCDFSFLEFVFWVILLIVTLLVYAQLSTIFPILDANKNIIGAPISVLIMIFVPRHLAKIVIKRFF